MAKRKNVALAKLVYSAMFLALGILLPFLTAQIKPFGVALSPMHLPVILCGFICGPIWGMTVGAVTPLLRSVVFNAPALMPDAVTMVFELATYAFIAGLLYNKLPKNIGYTYISLITAMVSGRFVWGLVRFILIYMGKSLEEIGFELIWTKTVLETLPGIVVQLLLIPPIIAVLKQNRLMLN